MSTSTPPGNVAIAAAHEVRPGRYPELDRLRIQEYVLAHFLDACPLSPDVVDGLMVAPAGMADSVGADVFVHERLTDALGLAPRFAETINAGGATYATMVARATAAIRAGSADAVLCVGAGKFPVVGGGGGDTMAKIVSHPDFEYPYGSFIPAMYALAATRHMYERGTTRQALAQVAVTSRDWALRHPDALMRGDGPLTAADVFDSRPIASPFNLYDCSVPCEGGAVVLVAREEIARELSDQPAYIRGYGEYHDHGAIAHASDFTTMGAGKATRAAFQMAGLTPSDVDVAQLYDAFSSCPIWLLEEAGLAERGKGGTHYLDGQAGLGGALPVNTYGGLLSFGHTGDASGMSMLVEGALQVMGRAGDRQVEADVALVQTYGGMMADHCALLLGRQP
ncbi:MAG: thiolase family protein [Salinisphaera sp.]|nr:thiolase family protein [Salinisphaera sp.]